jgi:betaine lipid synthase
MDFLGGNILDSTPRNAILFSGVAVLLLVGACFSTLLIKKSQKGEDSPDVIRSLWLFFYNCFLKPHDGDAKHNQQDALESFYKGQAGAYDATRKALLKGREDMLALAAAQVIHKANQDVEGRPQAGRRVWVDVSDYVLQRLYKMLTRLR